MAFIYLCSVTDQTSSNEEISNPRLVVLVGSLGLASNMVGLFLFHGTFLARFTCFWVSFSILMFALEHGHDHGHSHGKESPSASKPASIHSSLDDGQATPRAPTTPSPARRKSRERSASYSSLYGHPAATRASIVQAAHEVARARSPSPSRINRSRSRADRTSMDSTHDETICDSTETVRETATEATPLLQSDAASTESASHTPTVGGHSHGHGGHGHSHGSMNMRALLLHVLGDALGNVGVIATGLVIWLTTWSWKFYFDPIISLVITVIIFSSALPLGKWFALQSAPFASANSTGTVRSTAFILLQGVPATVSLDEVRDAILAVDGVLSVHELHIWQLSENKIVASVHVMASRKHDFMPVAAQIRKVMHDRGVHSCTIQPEYHPPRNAPPDEHLRVGSPPFDLPTRGLTFDHVDVGRNFVFDCLSSRPILQPVRELVLS